MVASITAYLLIVVGTNALGSDAFAPVAIVWTCWIATAAVITFPLQHWLVRAMTADEPVLRRTVVSLIATIALSVVTTLVCVGFRSELFDSEALAYAFIIGLLPLGSWGIGVSRGLLASRGSFGLVAVSIAGENVIRLTAGVVVVAAGGGPELFAASLLSGFVVVLIAVPGDSKASISSPSLRPEVAVLGGLMVTSILIQITQTAPPVVAAALGATPSAVTGVFIVLLLARIPYFVANTVSIRATDLLTMAHLEGRRDRLAKILRITFAAVAGVAAISVALAVTIGPAVVHLFFGADTEVTRVGLALGAVAGPASVGVLMATLVLAAEGRSWTSARAAGVGVAAGALVVVINPSRPSTVALAAFATASLLSFVLVTALGLRTGRTLTSNPRVAGHDR